MNVDKLTDANIDEVEFNEDLYNRCIEENVFNENEDGKGEDI